MEDHYEVLGVPRDCEQGEIKKAYRTLAREYHPDKNKNRGLSDAELAEIRERYMKIHKAFEVLSDPELRAEYDKSGISAGRGETIIDPIQAMMRMMEEKNETGVPDVIVPIETTVGDLYRGFSRDVEFERISACDRCHGHGTRNKKRSDCPHCKGRGMTLERIEGGEIGYSYKESVCDLCRGSSIDPDVKKCKDCDGSKYDREAVECEVEIPKGAYEGYFIKIDGEGNYIPEENRINPDVERTDVIFVIADVSYDTMVKESRRKKDVVYPTFRRGIVIKELDRADRADLMVTLEVDFAEAICGISRKIMHLDGNILEVEVDDPVVNNDIIVVPERGMPVVHDEVIDRKKRGDDSKYGDLLIRFDIKRPKLDKGVCRKLWQVLTGTSYQKRLNLEDPEPFDFLDHLIADRLDEEQDRTEEGSYSVSESDSSESEN
jgi:DnaJ-class molecular chaperone